MILSRLNPPKPKKAKPEPSYQPHECVVLAVDTAQRSGWALYVRGDLVNWGEVDMLDPRKSSDRDGISGWDARRVCLHAMVESGAQEFGLPVVLVFERPFRGTTQGAWIGSWRAAFFAEGGGKRRVLGVYPSTVRARVLGNGSMTREAARAAEMRRARAVVGPGPEIGPDSAAAIVIGCWAIRAGEVRLVLPKTKVRPPRKVAV